MQITIDPASDQAILTALREGRHRRAARILVRYYGRAVFNLCCKLAGDVEQAEDLTQACFKRALCSLPSLQGYSSTLQWLETNARASWAEQQERAGQPQGDEDARTPAEADNDEPRGISESLQRRLDMLAACL